MTHYSEEMLLQYAEGSSPIGSEIASHAAECSVCRSAIDEQRELIDVLAEAEVWGEFQKPVTVPSRIRELNDIEALIKREDADAAALLDDVLEGPAAWWATRLMKSAPRLTAGIVRQLLARTEGLDATNPQQAHELTRLAVDVAEELSIGEYPGDIVLTARGHAWREHAYLQMCLGRYPESLQSTGRAESAFSQLAISDYELARVRLVRAYTLRCLGNLDDAAGLERQSAQVFRAHGDFNRYVIARMSEATTLQMSARYEDALAVWRELHATPNLDPNTRVAVTHDLGICYRLVGELAKAIEYVTAAAAEYDLLGETVPANKARWSVGATLVAAGKSRDAVPILRTTWKQFEQLGMEADAALVGLELAEALLLSDQADEVPAICRTVLDRFTRAGMTSRAINALAFLREAVALGEAKPTLVRHVHDFLRKLPPEASRLAIQPPRNDD